jgi:hypothetical protein
MSDQRRERQAVEQIVRMEPVARQCIFAIDNATLMIGNFAGQLQAVGGERFLAPFNQIVQALQEFREMVVKREGSLIAIANAALLPPPTPINGKH